MTAKVFLSVGSTANDTQEKFVQLMEEFLEGKGLTPQTVGRSYFSSKQPLVAIDELLQECVGTVIIAYERTHLETAVEKRGSPKEKALDGLNLPTVWNQIEATMAYTLGHPLLVLVEKGLKTEGLLEQGYDWFVQEIALDQTVFEDRMFQGVFADWKKRIAQYQQEQKRRVTTGETEQQAAPVLEGPRDDAAAQRRYLTRLRKQLADHFSDEELHALCFDLGIDYANLPGDSKFIKALELVADLNRKNRLTELVEAASDMRPGLSWE
ncbi:MAG: hypothetical protein H6667_16650 [Ardenticatenaceae bacterium]|nr:hypothetical protein [Ardenticatenaceae bacterium]MCB9446315.1 hypothetical protein [Ardenticatenaceae bacterium]